MDRVISEADGYQPHLVAPEMGYRRLLQSCLTKFKVLECCAFRAFPALIHRPLLQSCLTMFQCIAGQRACLLQAAKICTAARLDYEQ